MTTVWKLFFNYKIAKIHYVNLFYTILYVGFLKMFFSKIIVFFFTYFEQARIDWWVLLAGAGLLILAVVYQVYRQETSAS